MSRPSFSSSQVAALSPMIGEDRRAAERALHNGDRKRPGLTSGKPGKCFKTSNKENDDRRRWRGLNGKLWSGDHLCPGETWLDLLPGSTPGDSRLLEDSWPRQLSKGSHSGSVRLTLVLHRAPGNISLLTPRRLLVFTDLAGKQPDLDLRDKMNDLDLRDKINDLNVRDKTND
ncbi:hypothetical protein RRG08_024856 [Elysia crispata]|uniref:Uncharacterized protein n=1 Tax=Elysia crispata TaxID=231223 RepID=A0AAE1CZP6_9GAST|nr:hypothetical protein RRG08_024856 [Elysia crispata]